MSLCCGVAHAQQPDVPTDAPAATQPVVQQTNQATATEPATSRYLYAPSALPLGKGHWYFSQKELFFTGVATGLTDNISILVGSVVPALFVSAVMGEPDALNGIVAIRGSGAIGEQFWMGGGTEVFTFAGGGYGLPFVNATVGKPDHHVTLATGAGVQIPRGKVDFVPVILAGEHRISQYGAIVTENWFISPVDSGSEPLLLVSAGWRFIAGRLTADVAVVNLINNSFIPIPWLDIAYHWGPRR